MSHAFHGVVQKETANRIGLVCKPLMKRTPAEQYVINRYWVVLEELPFRQSFREPKPMLSKRA